MTPPVSAKNLPDAMRDMKTEKTECEAPLHPGAKSKKEHEQEPYEPIEALISTCIIEIHDSMACFVPRRLRMTIRGLGF